MKPSILISVLMFMTACQALPELYNASEDNGIEFNLGIDLKKIHPSLNEKD